jgi:hypothetical protein
MISKKHLYSLFFLIIGVVLTAQSQMANAAESLSSFQSHKHDRTEIRLLTPFTAAGLNPKLKVSKEVEGICWSNSSVNSSRPNTWRCHSDNTVYDPCFINPIHNQYSVVCLESPWSKNVVKLKLKSPLPSTKADTFVGSKSQPWAIELSNGRLCTMISGPTSAVSGMPIKYQCNSNAVVLGDIDRSNHKWVVFYLGNDDLYMHQIPISLAWY